MDYKIITNRGFDINVTGGFTPEDFIAKLNDQQLLTMALADMVLRKSNFRTITPAGELTGAYELHTTDGNMYLTDIVDYDNQTLSDFVNNARTEFILIGNIIIQRHNFDMVRAVPVA